MTKELQDAITAIQKLKTSPVRSTTQTTHDEVEAAEREYRKVCLCNKPGEANAAYIAARLAGKIEGLREAYAAALNIKEMPLDKEGDAMLSAIRAMIAELQATTTPALPGSSEQA